MPCAAAPEPHRRAGESATRQNPMRQTLPAGAGDRDAWHRDQTKAVLTSNALAGPAFSCFVRDDGLAVFLRH
jgi:hypothetical protein